MWWFLMSNDGGNGLFCRVFFSFLLFYFCCYLIGLDWMSFLLLLLLFLLFTPPLFFKFMILLLFSS